VSGLPVVPNLELGQHFLVDENIVRVAGRLAGLAADDVVLEIGPGLGILTSYLADRVRLVHTVELDRSLEPHLRARLGERDDVRLEFADALSFPLASLEPPPTKLVANLPYQIATPLVVESLDALPRVASWCVMVQREVADRFFAASETRSYGAVSVLVRLTAERTGLHPVSRSCFQPSPNVDSALVAFRRVRDWGNELGPLKQLVQGSFSHRRKTLANSLELAGIARREDSVAALAAIGRNPRVRAEDLGPDEFPRLAEALSHQKTR
jgi:16S rRNA (adenine1518-N6/adenine1519-N6)-dimethyltransferase